MTQRIFLRLCVIGYADHADFTGGDQPIKGGGGFCRMGKHVGSVDLVKVNMLGLQTRQRGINGAVQIIGSGMIGQAGYNAALAGQHHFVTQMRIGGQHFAEQCLAFAKCLPAPVKAVNIGIVDKRQPRLKCRFNARCGVCNIVTDQPPTAESQRPNRFAANHAGLSLHQIFITILRHKPSSDISTRRFSTAAICAATPIATARWPSRAVT